MGLLSEGTPLGFRESAPYRPHVRTHGVRQLINAFHRLKDRQSDHFMWGDEIEYLIVRLPDKQVEGDTVQLSLRSAELRKEIAASADAASPHGSPSSRDSSPSHKLPRPKFLPEYGSFMIEATPGQPYGKYAADLCTVEASMRLRRQIIENHLKDNERVVLMGSFPLMGVGSFTHPPASPMGPIARSIGIPDIAINPHPRFGALTANIRERRGSNVDIRIPLFRDLHKPVDAAGQEISEIRLDAMAYGMGCCCLQTTFQCRSLSEARNLYDQLAVLAPIMLALTASTPFHGGLIADTDVRWNVISAAVDDRTPAERGEEPLSGDREAGSRFRLHKSRYAAASRFIGDSRHYRDGYNDVDAPFDPEIEKQLLQEGFPAPLARHFAHLFSRDPLVIYKELIDQDDDHSLDHFENIQSTNWQSVRFKPPPVHSDIGWRVEFRTMEISITDFENAAFSVFIALVARAILFFDLNLYIPLSRVDENMSRAHANNAVVTQQFWWRSVLKNCSNQRADAEQPREKSIGDILAGDDDDPGLIATVRAYLSAISVDEDTLSTVKPYLDFIERRAKGELLTTAQWMRQFVMQRPDYAKQRNSRLSPSVVRELVEMVDFVAHGRCKAPQLLGDYVYPPNRTARGDLAEALGQNVQSEKTRAAPTLLRGSSFVCDLTHPTDICVTLQKLLDEHLPPEKRPVSAAARSKTDSLSSASSAAQTDGASSVSRCGSCNGGRSAASTDHSPADSAAAAAEAMRTA